MTYISATGLLVFLALLGSSFGVKCKSCVSPLSKECKEEEIECGDSKCLTLSQYYKNGGNTYHTFLKTCAKNSPCDALGSMTQEDVKIRVSSLCCSGDNCNADHKYYIPPDDNLPNGVKCPSCYKNDTTDGCVSEKDVECRGTEVKCVNYRGNVMNPDQTVGEYSMQGCLNEIGCTENFGLLAFITEQMRKELKC